MEILNQFGINPLLLTAQVVNFFILLFILKKLLYGPILKVLADRRKKIEESLRNAEEIELKLQQTQEKAEQILAKATEEGQKILTETQKMRDQILDEARENATLTAATIFKKEQDAIRAEKAKIMEEARAEVADLVAVIFQKLTGKTLTKDDHRQMIEKEVKNLS